MAEIMVSASTGVMNSLLGKLTNLLGEEIAKCRGSQKKLQFLSEELRSMNLLLEKLADMDDLDSETKYWRNQVREMSYDIEDIIDDFMLHKEDKSETNGLMRRLNTLRSKYQISGRIKEIKNLLHDASERRRRYKLDERITRTSNVAIDKRVVALYANVAHLVGLEVPMNKLVKWLIDGDLQLKVVSIVGFGGLGKTTLADQAYRKLQDLFDCRVFLTVSQKPDIKKILSNLLSKLRKLDEEEPSCHSCELHDLLDDLRNRLQDKRYFIVIDDLWDTQAWDAIKCAFPQNNRGSRVITTTRIQSVAMACCSNSRQYILNMEPLSEADSRRLFFGRIFGSKDSCPRQLQDVSFEILKKCGGLPLAINSIASLLASEAIKKGRWEHVRDSLNSIHGTNRTIEEMRQILNLSYSDLPHHLKTCLLYLGMYPEDHLIQTVDLALQWAGEGFVRKWQGQPAEKVARSYLNELINRSLIQPVRFGNNGSIVTVCKVHDMMLDLILLKCAEENFVTVINNSRAIMELQHKARRMSLCLEGAAKNDDTLLSRKACLSQVRAVAIFRTSQCIEILSLFKVLRVLVLDFYACSSVRKRNIDLTGLCKLYQLRYIKIEGCSHCDLPRQIRQLQYLETFDIDDGGSIPLDIVHLPRLLHLRIPKNARLPEGISNMKSLCSLNIFDLMNNSIDNIKRLGELTNLSTLSLGGFCFKRDTDMATCMDILCSSLGKLCNLEHLYIFFPLGCIDGLSNLSHPPLQLERLPLSYCWFSRVPGWMSELHNLWELELTIAELDEDGINVLADLPVLTYLNLQIRRTPTQNITIPGSSFLLLNDFTFRCSRMSGLTFQVGAMRKLQGLLLHFNALGWEKNGAAPAGIEHLPALQVISVELGCHGASESDRSGVESALRNAINIHPSQPRFHITFTENSSFIFDDL